MAAGAVVDAAVVGAGVSFFTPGPISGFVVFFAADGPCTAVVCLGAAVVDGGAVSVSSTVEGTASTVALSLSLLLFVCTLSSTM